MGYFVVTVIALVFFILLVKKFRQVKLNRRTVEMFAEILTVDSKLKKVTLQTKNGIFTVTAKPAMYQELKEKMRGVAVIADEKLIDFSPVTK
ncbi:hypothetical protein [Enterococcus timonensis]|uniref:hypothetical protein n=1 Tax=Enterococcus timonensis TaxID=1852364 RepID=UPI0008DAF21F|nr:hypothetical protein [Enterococcus timonensis]